MALKVPCRTASAFPRLVSKGHEPDIVRFALRHRFQKLRGIVGAAIVDKNKHHIVMLADKIDESVTFQAISFVVARDRDGDFSQSFSDGEE